MALAVAASGLITARHIRVPKNGRRPPSLPPRGARLVSAALRTADDPGVDWVEATAEFFREDTRPIMLFDGREENLSSVLPLSWVFIFLLSSSHFFVVFSLVPFLPSNTQASATCATEESDLCGATIRTGGSDSRRCRAMQDGGCCRDRGEPQTISPASCSSRRTGLTLSQRPWQESWNTYGCPSHSSLSSSGWCPCL